MLSVFECSYVYLWLQTVLVSLAALAVAKATWAPAVWGGHGAWAGHGVAPLPVHDTPEVAAAKAAHLAAHHAAASRAGHGYAGAWAHDGHDGQWRGEGLAESQDNGSWKSAGHDGHDGEWRGEGLSESQDNGQWNGVRAYNSAGAHTGAASYNGLTGYNSASAYHGASAWNGNGASWGVYGAGHGIQYTPEVAAARAAHLAAHAAAASHSHH